MRIIIERSAWLTLLQRLGWFVGLWAAGVLSVAGVAFALRYIMRAL